MRFVGILIALGAIGWFLYQGSGGNDSEGAIPEAYNQSIEKAEGVEKTVQDAAAARLQQVDPEAN